MFCRFKRWKESRRKNGFYGIGVSRLVAAIIEAKYNNNIMRWPESVAPFDVAIIPSLQKNDKSNYLKAQKIYNSLIKNKIDVLFDDTDEHLSALSEAGIEAEVKEQEDDMTEIPDGKWKEDPMTEAQANFMLNTLIPECIDAGQDAIAQEAKTKVQSGELSKGQASDLITKLKESKAK